MLHVYIFIYDEKRTFQTFQVRGLHATQKYLMVYIYRVKRRMIWKLYVNKSDLF